MGPAGGASGHCVRMAKAPSASLPVSSAPPVVSSTVVVVPGDVVDASDPSLDVLDVDVLVPPVDPVELEVVWPGTSSSPLSPVSAGDEPRVSAASPFPEASDGGGEGWKHATDAMPIRRRTEARSERTCMNAGDRRSRKPAESNARTRGARPPMAHPSPMQG